jgi:hypothetical protein
LLGRGLYSFLAYLGTTFSFAFSTDFSFNL